MKQNNIWSVTSYGYSASRWLSYALASNPKVYVAHGTYAFDSVMKGDYNAEKKQAKGNLENLDALISGRELVTEVKSSTLSDLYGAYQTQFPDKKSYGNVHSFVCRELFYKDDYQILTPRAFHLIREPIAFIESHSSGVISAEKVSELKQAYNQFFTLFIKRFPEIVACEWFDRNSLEQKAFLLSLYSLHNIAQDEIRYGKIMQTIHTEQVTSSVTHLRETCEAITKDEYDVKKLSAFIKGGAINRHRNNKLRTNEQALFSNWVIWKHQAFDLIIEKKGYAKCLKGLGFHWQADITSF